MDMYRILESFDAVNSRATVAEGEVKRQMHADADEMSRAEFVAKYGAESGEFWDNIRGELDEERRSPEEFDAAALAKQKARLAREKQRIQMQRKISGQDSGKPPVVRDVSEDDVEEGNRFAYNVLKAKAAGKTQADLDGDGKMEPVTEVFPGTSEYELRFGKDDAASAFDKKKVSTGTVYSRKHFDEPESDDDAPRAAGRPVGTGRKLGARGPSVASKLLKGKGGLKEMEHDHQYRDPDEYDQEGQMARQDLHSTVNAAKELHDILGSDENLPEWVQSKITKALDYIDTANDYMQSIDVERGEQPMAEIAPVIGAMAGRALAGAAGAGSVGQALGGLAGRAVAGAMNSGDDELEEASPPGGFQAGDRVTVDGQKGPTGSTTGVFVQQLPTRNDQKPAYAFRFDDKKYPGNTYDTVAGNQIFPADMKESALQGYLGKKKYGADGMKALQQAGRDGASKEKMAKIRAQHDQMDEADMAEADYSAKSARAGKDIGRPGKNFGKIARDAAERYGSKAAGERVAGAVLHKLRAKEGVEEESADKKDPPFSADKQSPFKKATNPNRSASDTVKALAQKGLADMTTADLRAELKRRDKVDEESTDTRDQHAERAGKKVTKDIEYDDKKDKEEKVDETTVSGSVAPAAGGDAPKKGKGGMQFGKGVYEAHVAESFEKQLKNVLNEGMSISVSTDDMGKKNITVSATDADADALGDMLKMAGLFSSESHSQSCGSCGMMHEAGVCPQQMEEDLANTPNEMYADADYMTQTLSGGLNGPKTTGQTTGPVVNRQPSRQGVMAEAEQVKAASESRLWNLYRKI